MTTEADITKKAIAALKKMQRTRTIKILGHSGQEAGISDILACVCGRFLAIEMKQPNFKHKVSALQALFLDDIEAAGGYAAVCSSVEEVERAACKAWICHKSDWRNEADERAFPNRDRNYAKKYQ